MRVCLIVVTIIALAACVVYATGRGWLGEEWGAGEIEGAALPDSVVAQRAEAQRRAAVALSPQEAPADRQILFGDLHVHSTYSLDAFMMSLPLAGGDGAHPVADACDFARYCSALDFWSINDHAETSSPTRWAETVDAIRQCNAVAGDGGSPDVVAYLGWEWTQMGATPETHWGHKNVVLRDLEDGRIPLRPIASAANPLRDAAASSLAILGFGLLPFIQGDPVYLDVPTYLNAVLERDVCPINVPTTELPPDCHEEAATPAALFAKLDEWGDAALVIPHGTSWGAYTPPGSSWDHQLDAGEHDPKYQRLIEVMSGHGNSEEYRDWRPVTYDAQGRAVCPVPTRDFEPSCWRAGEIVRERCLAAGEGASECEVRAAKARQDYADVPSVVGQVTVPGARPEEWLDSGQCRDCYLPPFGHRPLGSVQYIMALRKPAEAGAERFRFGFMASSDNHTARPGTGYKEFARREMTEARLGLPARMRPKPRVPDPPPAHSVPLVGPGRLVDGVETERQASFFYPGGLVAVHAQGRDREAIWEALERKEVYGTSGPRILLWFDLLNAPGADGPLPMGSEIAMHEPPSFQVRAAGSLAQRPGCPDFATEGLSPARLARLCQGECYNPGDERRLVTRIEVVRIRPQLREGEPFAELIEDPWRVFACEPDPAGCTVTFTDPDFPGARRDALYYARAIEAPSPQINADTLRCERDADGNCLRVDFCDPLADDECLADAEERAWSSPIFVDFGG